MQLEAILHYSIFIIRCKFWKIQRWIIYFFLISFILAIFQEDQRSIAISSIKCVNIKILQFKIMHKSGVYGWTVNNIRLVWILTYKLRTCNLMMRFSKYEFNKNLLGDIILLRVIIYYDTWVGEGGTSKIDSFQWVAGET